MCVRMCVQIRRWHGAQVVLTFLVDVRLGLGVPCWL